MVRTGFVLSVLLLLAFAGPAKAAHVRVTCKGIQKLSSVEPSVECSESNHISDSAHRIYTGFTSAAASLARGRLFSEAAGNDVREGGYNGGEASALFMDSLTVQGEWEGTIPVRVSMRVAYAFAGYGEGRLDAHLSTSTSGDPTGDNRARVRLFHTALNGAALINVDSRGSFQVPANGAYDPRGLIHLEVTEMVSMQRPTLELRAEVRAIALPNLGSLGSSLHAAVHTDATFRVALPCAFRVRAVAFLTEARTALACDSALVPPASLPRSN